MRTLIALLPALLIVACDTSDATKAPPSASADAKNTGAAGKTDANAAPKLDEGRTAVSGDRKGLSDCLTDCSAGNQSDTDRATCRLNCEASFKAPTGGDASAGAGAAGGTPTAAATGPDPVDKTVTCMSDCYTRGGAQAGAGNPDAKACMDSCKTSAAGGTNAPGTAVLDTLGTCVGACYADKTLSETNRATCELNCAQTARVAGPAQPADRNVKGG